MSFPHRATLLSLIAFLGVGVARSANRTDIHITGKVTGPGGEKIAKAMVALIGQSLNATTDANGDYSLSGATGILPAMPGDEFPKDIVYRDGSISFGVPRANTSIRIELFNTAGKRIHSTPVNRYPAGRFSRRMLETGSDSQLYLLGLQIGNEYRVCKLPLVHGLPHISLSGRASKSPDAGLEKSSANALDSLRIKADGYITKTVSVENYVSTMDVSLLQQFKDPGLSYPAYSGRSTDLIVPRTDYAERLDGFWLGESIANWTGLITEFDRVGMPRTAAFYTDADWGGPDFPSMWGGRHPSPVIAYFFFSDADPWGADDDTDLEYMYQHLLDRADTSILSAGQIKEGWLNHIYDQNQPTPFGKDEDPTGGYQNYLWVSNQRAFDLMRDKGMLPPNTSLPANNPSYMSIDAQLTTEIFGCFSPARTDVALKMAYLPIRTTAYSESESIARFYVTMHSLAPVVLNHPAHKGKTLKEKVVWLADSAYRQLPTDTYPRKMYDFVKAAYDANPDKDNWERTRDAVYLRYQGDGNTVKSADGYSYSGAGNAMSNQGAADAGINFASSLVSLFHGEGDILRTVRIGALAGWDSDNPTATWGGLLGFMLGKSGVEAAFRPHTGKKLSETFWIHRTRRNFPDYTPALEGEDSFPLMAKRGIFIIDRVVQEEMGGGVDLVNDVWHIPNN